MSKNGSRPTCWSRACFAMRRHHTAVRLFVLLWSLAFIQSGTAGEDNSRGSISEQLNGLETVAKAAFVRPTHDASKYAHLVNQLRVLVEENKKLENLEEELVQRTLALQDVIRQANAVQLKYLAWQLNVTLEQELQNRAIIEEESVDETTGPNNAVTPEQLEEQIQPARILAESETKLSEWILNMISEEVANYHAEAVARVGKCVTPVEAAQLVQASLMTYAHDGMVDHAQGAQIVHELTSDTYIPPADPSQLLGNVWWRKYIPEDWERVFPSGWEDWSVVVPLFLAHSLGWSAETVPPEAILTSPTYPGSCWPMKGRKGQVTIRLPYPVSVKAVTIDHTSSLLVDVSSAPKIIRVVAYPPCSDCQGMGFDVNDAWELTRLEYNAQGRSTQTFEIPPAAGSCSEEALSCSAESESLGQLHVASQKDMAVAGITVAILDNWGVDDYTCLYRFRVHGDVAET